MGKITLHVILVSSVFFTALYAWNLSTKSKSGFIMIAEEPIKVYEDFPASGFPSGQVIGLMSKGEVARISHREYSKDFIYYKVQLHNGIKGYVLGDLKVLTVQPVNKD